jgi:hypothetical protein
MPGRGRIYLFSPPSLRPHRLWGPLSSLSNYPMNNGGVRTSEGDANHSLPSSAGLKNMWRYTITPPYVFMTWCIQAEGTTQESKRMWPDCCRKRWLHLRCFTIWDLYFDTKGWKQNSSRPVIQAMTVLRPVIENAGLQKDVVVSNAYIHWYIALT